MWNSLPLPYLQYLSLCSSILCLLSSFYVLLYSFVLLPLSSPFPFPPFLPFSSTFTFFIFSPVHLHPFPSVLSFPFPSPLISPLSPSSHNSSHLHFLSSVLVVRFNAAAAPPDTLADDLALRISGPESYVGVR